jgi:hypothetical protein
MYSLKVLAVGASLTLTNIFALATFVHIVRILSWCKSKTMVWFFILPDFQTVVTHWKGF